MADQIKTQDGWHLDRRVPISLIVTILLQTAGLVWWASGVENRVAALEKWQEARPPHLPSDTSSRLVTVENNQSHLLRTLERLETLMTRLDERLRKREIGK